MRLLARMESWKTRGLNVFVMLLLALSLAACNENKNDFHQYESSNLKERSIPREKKYSQIIIITENSIDHYHHVLRENILCRKKIFRIL